MYTCTAFFCPLQNPHFKIVVIVRMIRGSMVIGLKVIYAKNFQKTTFLAVFHIKVDSALTTEL